MSCSSDIGIIPHTIFSLRSILLYWLTFLRSGFNWWMMCERHSAASLASHPHVTFNHDPQEDLPTPELHAAVILDGSKTPNLLRWSISLADWDISFFAQYCSPIQRNSQQTVEQK